MQASKNSQINGSFRKFLDNNSTEDFFIQDYSLRRFPQCWFFGNFWKLLLLV